MIGDLGDDDGAASRGAATSHCCAHDAGVDRHADAHEEQAEQDAAERLDVGLELMAEVRFGEEHAGEEGAHGHRQADLSP